MASSTVLPPAPPAPVITNPFSGDYRIDALIESPNYRWGSERPTGSAVSVSYSFMKNQPAYGDGGGSAQVGSFTPFTDNQKVATRTILNYVASFTQITFIEVDDTGNSYGQIAFGNNNQTVSSGYSFLPNSIASSQIGSDVNGDVWISNTYKNQTTPGSFGYSVLLHEIGHSLGLNHPGNYNAGNNLNSNGSGNYLGVTEDNYHYTVMSYRNVPQGQFRSSYGSYDILALQYLYGINSTNTSNDTYVFSDTNGIALQTIIDSSGVDSVDASKLTASVIVNLKPGAFSSVGKMTDGTLAKDNFDFSLGSIIENIKGSEYNDTLIGNSSDNVITPLGGDDSVDGSSGDDTVRYTGAASDYRITIDLITNTIHVSDTKTNRDGIDVIRSIEHINFSDKNIISGPTGLIKNIFDYDVAIGKFIDNNNFNQEIEKINTLGSSVYSIINFSSISQSDQKKLAEFILSNTKISIDNLRGSNPEFSYKTILEAVTVFAEIYPDLMGQVTLNLASLLSQLENDSVYGIAAQKFNDEVFNNYARVVLIGQEAWNAA